MEKKLIKLALEARKRAYTPYSNFAVGAALLCKDGSIYTGCNIENAAFTPTNCADRAAVFKAVSEGIREFDKIAIVGGKKDAQVLDYCAPCGVCRQVLTEFVKDDEFQVILAKNENEYKIYYLKELFPLSFGPKDL